MWRKTTQAFTDGVSMQELVLEIRRQMFEEDGAKMKVERPPEIQRNTGLIDAKRNSYEGFFEMHYSQNTFKQDSH